MALQINPLTGTAVVIGLGLWMAAAMGGGEPHHHQGGAVSSAQTASHAAEDHAKESLAPEPPSASGMVQSSASGAVMVTGTAEVPPMMVSAAHPLATEAGLTMLRAGGSAADALVAVQAMLTLVEPQSSGIGGGAFVMRLDPASGRIDSIDGRETAPVEAGSDLFLTAEGEPMVFGQANTGGRAVGAPGVLRALEMLHAAHGRLPWADLFAPAIAVAEEGFTVTPRLQTLIEQRAERLSGFPVSGGYFLPDGQPLQAGEILTNPALAETLRLIADQGADAFYEGPLAEAIIAAVQGHPTNPGLLHLDDLAQYAALQRPAVCVSYRAHDVCGMGPPSSGGVTVGQILGQLEQFDLSGTGPDHPSVWHLFAEASKRAYADRALFLADADFVPVPVNGLLNRSYLTDRAAGIDPAQAAPVPISAGEPPMGDGAIRFGRGDDREQPGTSHMVVVDADGLVLSMTSSIETAFGSGLMVGGFLLNSQLTDFSFRPETEDGVRIANRLEPGKRPRSSMAPTLVIDDRGRPVLAIGSPGGSRIIGYVAKSIVGVLDFGLDVQAAIDLPNVSNRNGPTDVEADLGPAADALAAGLSAKGHEISRRPMTSGLHGVQWVYDAPSGPLLMGGADPRREGVAAAP